MSPPRPSRTLLIAASLALAACARFAPAAPSCPQAAVIYGLDRLVLEAGAERAAPAVVRLEDVEGSCTLDDGVLTLDYTLDLVAARDLAGTGTGGGTAETIEVDWFSVIEAPDGRVLDKSSLEASLPLEPDAERVRRRETLRQTVTGVAPDETANYRVLFGLEVPRAQALERRRDPR